MLPVTFEIKSVSNIFHKLDKFQHHLYIGSSFFFFWRGINLFILFIKKIESFFVSAKLQISRAVRYMLRNKIRVHGYIQFVEVYSHKNSSSLPFSHFFTLILPLNWNICAFVAIRLLLLHIYDRLKFSIWLAFVSLTAILSLVYQTTLHLMK